MFIPGNQSQNDLRIWARNVGMGVGASGACTRLRYIAGSGAGAGAGSGSEGWGAGAGSAAGAGAGSPGMLPGASIRAGATWLAASGWGAGVGSCCSIFALFFDYAAKLGARLAGIFTNRAPKGRLTLIFYSIPTALQLPFELLAGHGAQALQGAVVGVVDGSRRDSELGGKLLLQL